MKEVARIASIGLILLAAVAISGCGDDGGDEPAGTVCERMCDTGPQDCPSAQPRDECVSSCDQMRDSLELCESQFDAEMECYAALPDSSFECDETGDVELTSNACAADAIAVNECTAEFYGG